MRRRARCRARLPRTAPSSPRNGSSSDAGHRCDGSTGPATWSEAAAGRRARGARAGGTGRSSCAASGSSWRRSSRPLSATGARGLPCSSRRSAKVRPRLLVGFVLPRRRRGWHRSRRVAGRWRRLPDYMIPARWVDAGERAVRADRQGGSKPAARLSRTQRIHNGRHPGSGPVRRGHRVDLAGRSRCRERCRARNFLDLGGNSMLAVQARVTDPGTARSPGSSLSDILLAPIRGGLAAQLREAAVRPRSPVSAPAVLRAGTAVVHRRRRAGFGDLQRPAAGRAGVARWTRTRCGGRCSPMLEKHEVLRTTYQDRDGGRVQVVGRADGSRSRSSTTSLDVR